MPAARPLVLLGMLALSCGGGPPEAKDARSAGPLDVSIGDTALAQGGIDSIGSNAGGASETSPGTLRASLVDKDNPVKLDGVLGEWGQRTPATVTVKGGGNVRFSVALQYDARAIYVGGEVTEESFYRTARFADGEDHAGLVLAFPTAGGGLRGYEVGLFAGKPRESVGEVRYQGSRHGEVPGSKIVEAPSQRGYTFEAVVPWSAFPEASAVRVGLRASARYYASDGSATPRSILATGPGDAASATSLPPLLTEAEQSLVDGLLTQKGLTAQPPKIDFVADVTGDGMKERVAVWGSFLTLCGPTYRGGREYFFRDVGGEILRVDARDITGRGKADLVVRRRFATDGATREWLEVYSLLRGDEPTITFTHEISVARDGKTVSNAVRLSGKEIVVSIEPATGWDASSYEEPIIDGADPLLLPWGTTRAATYRFDGAHFQKLREEHKPGAPAPKTPVEAKVALRPAEPPSPPVTVNSDRGAAGSSGDQVGRVFAQYRRDRGVPADLRPRSDLSVDVDGDGRPERVVLIGKDIVVMGPGFLGGTQYAFLGMSQFEDPGDVRDLTARDLTGDGGASLVVRGTRHVNVAGSSQPLEIDASFVYVVKGGAITRVFGIETGRQQGSKRAQGLVQFVPNPQGRGFVIDARPGRITGWTEKSYPWSQEQPGSGSLEPLVLPWGGIASLRYGWNGSTFARLP